MASTQDLPLPQSLATLQTGAASPGVPQKPRWQTDAPAQLQQSALLAQELRHAPFTHIWPAAQSPLARQPGWEAWFAVQSPLTQRSFEPQSVSALQMPWQYPFTQLPEAHCAFSTHCPPPPPAATQNPAEQASPVPQSLFAVQAASHCPLRQRPPTPHSVLKRQVGAGTTMPLQLPFVQHCPAAQSPLLSHETPAADGTRAAGSPGGRATSATSPSATRAASARGAGYATRPAVPRGRRTPGGPAVTGRASPSRGAAGVALAGLTRLTRLARGAGGSGAPTSAGTSGPVPRAAAAAPVGATGCGAAARIRAAVATSAAIAVTVDRRARGRTVGIVAAVVGRNQETTLDRTEPNGRAGGGDERVEGGQSARVLHFKSFRRPRPRKPHASNRTCDPADALQRICA